MNALRVYWASRTCLPYSEEAAPKRGGQGVSSLSPSVKSPWIELVRKKAALANAEPCKELMYQVRR